MGMLELQTSIQRSNTIEYIDLKPLIKFFLCPLY
jgi:hypothetical protein